MERKSLKITLLGFLLILISLFFMGICILNDGNTCAGVSLALMILGTLTTIVGLLWDVKM